MPAPATLRPDCDASARPDVYGGDPDVVSMRGSAAVTKEHPMRTRFEGLIDGFGRSTENDDGWPVARRDLVVLVGLFLAVNLFLAWVLQLRSGDPPNTPGGSVDQFDSFILWSAALFALLVALMQRRPLRARVLWFGLSLGFMLFAIDEVFEFHEESKAVVGDDDYIKIVMWMGACTCVFLLWRFARIRPHAMKVFAAAIMTQTAWLLSDMGDGDFFRVPIPLGALHWIEEYLELVTSSLFVIGLLLHFMDIVTERASRPPADRAAVSVLADAERS